MDQNVAEMSCVMGHVVINSQHQVLEDNHAYSNIDNMQQHVFVVCSNPAYGTVQPVLPEGHAYSTIDDVQQQAVVSSGLPGHDDGFTSVLNDNPAYCSVCRSVLSLPGSDWISA